MISHNVLLTDLYQLTMLQGYFEQNMKEIAAFEFFVRKLPKNRNFLMAAGLEQALDFLQNVHFTGKDIEWLAKTGLFSPQFLRQLTDFKFTGDVHAMPEGSIFFPNEPIFRVTAPIAEAQLVESRIINLIHFQTMIASKAARSVLVERDKLLVDFGFRRAHGAEAGLLAARASYLAGFSGTATVSAGQLFNIPVYGTMAHSFVQAHSNEIIAFENFAKANPDNVVLLIDTYDTEAGALKVVDLAPRLHEMGIKIKGVRLDSGDLADHARKVRNILDQGDLKYVTIFASGNIDEYKLADFKSKMVPIDGFGIGTHLDTSADAPYLDCAYKLQEYAGVARRKRSEGKATWPGRKQVFRHFDEEGLFLGDTITLENLGQEGIPLLIKVMEKGIAIVSEQISLQQSRVYARKQLNRLPNSLKNLEQSVSYPVTIAKELDDLALAVDLRELN